MASKKSFLAGLLLCCLTQVAYADDLGLSKKFSQCIILPKNWTEQ